MPLNPDFPADELDEPIIRPVRFAFIDFDGEPLRLTDAPYAVTFAGTGDEDLDGFTFAPFGNQPLSVSEVQQNERGAESVIFKLSAINTDADDLNIMNVLGDLPAWRGRVARLWRALIGPDLVMIGYPDAYFTGYLSTPTFEFAAAGSTIQVSAETYLASLTNPTNRSYLSQSDYDSGDLSAEASIAVANGIEGNAIPIDPSFYARGYDGMPF